MGARTAGRVLGCECSLSAQPGPVRVTGKVPDSAVRAAADGPPWRRLAGGARRRGTLRVTVRRLRLIGRRAVFNGTGCRPSLGGGCHGVIVIPRPTLRGSG